MEDGISEDSRDSSDHGSVPSPLSAVDSPRSSSDSGHQHHQNVASGRRDEATNPPPYSDKEHADEPEEEPEEERSLLSRLAIPLALVVGCAITGGTTYALVARVQGLIANATVGGDAARWKQAARTQAYDACYHGCSDCSDPDFAYNACQLTARADVGGVVCDGNRMWNWAPADRYPEPCLAAVGRLLMGEELERVRQSYRNQLAIVILTVLGGVAGGIVTYLLWRRLTMSKRQREAAKARKHKKIRNLPAGSQTRTWTIPRRSRSSTARRGPRLAGLVTALFAGSKAKPADAYPCTGHDPAWSQYFIRANDTAPPLAGVVHGWLSDCRDRQDCSQRCSNSCTSSGGSRSCSRKCTNVCHTETYSVRRPKDYVDAVLPRVAECGFRLVDALPGGVSATERVGNAGLERGLWVRVSVSGFNVTRREETDEAVWCLHRIGG